MNENKTEIKTRIILAVFNKFAPDKSRFYYRVAQNHHITLYFDKFGDGSQWIKFAKVRKARGKSRALYFFSIKNMKAFEKNWSNPLDVVGNIFFDEKRHINTRGLRMKKQIGDLCNEYSIKKYFSDIIGDLYIDEVNVKR